MFLMKSSGQRARGKIRLIGDDILKLGPGRIRCTTTYRWFHIRQAIMVCKEAETAELGLYSLSAARMTLSVHSILKIVPGVRLWPQ